MIAQPSLFNRACAALVALATLALCVALTTGTAAAAEGSGEVTLSFKSDAKGSLSKQGVKVSYSAKAGKTGAAKRAGGAQVVSLPVDRLTPGPAAVVGTSGSLSLSLKGKTVSLSDVTLQVGGKSTAIGAKLGKEKLVFFRAKGKARTDASSVSLDNAALSLTSKGAKALREALGAGGLSAGPVGTAKFYAALVLEAPSQPVRSPLPAPPAKIDDGGLLPPDEGPAPIPYPYSAQCPVGKASGNPGFGSAPGTVAGIAALPTFDPGTEQSLSGNDIAWGFKTTFRNYVLNVGGDHAKGTLQTLDGAGSTPAGATMAAAGSTFDFPFANGTYEAGVAPDHSDDKLVTSATGTALFCKSGHGFSVVIKDPTVTIDGANSRITADVGVNQNGTWYPFQRADIAELDLSGVEPQVGDGGNTLVWEDIPVKLSADGATATGLYPAGETLDPITVETSLDRPMLTQCTIASGDVPPTTAVDFTQAVLPTLTNPVTGSGGTINWGFRRSLRSSVQATGTFQLLGGATAGFPGNMGGGNEPAPAGGLGKFFRFPIASYQYEEGVPGDPSDDRLIATSNATVGFCNPAAGNYGVVISKPTLIIDGGNSRLVANVYSYSGGFPTPSPKGWLGGRVDLVDLDTSAVGATSGLNSVRWGDVPADNTPITTGIPVDGGLKTEALSLANLTMASTASGGFDPVSAQIALPPEPHPFETECPVPFVEGSDGFGDLPSEVSGLAAAPTFNPGTAQSVAGTSIEWGFKDSFRNYVINVPPPGGSIQALDGAVANPAGASMAAPGSFFDFPVAEGTYEPGTAPDHSDDKLVVKGSGTALFCKAGHGFNVALKNPELVIDGDDSRIVADVGVNQNGTWYGFQRADIAELDLSGVEPQVSDSGNTLVWEDIPAKLSADGDLATGLYDEGEGLDPITVRTSLQRPLLTQCTIASGDVPPTTVVDFTQAALPTLTSPVTGTGGTINWGFRRSLRSSVQATGSFQLLGGATANYPNMGGGNEPAPAGGLGKFFRFPIASYEYEEGEAANPNDDRLIATSNATVGFCNPAAGNYGVVISKPTLVIDGGNSRLVANVYSYSGGFPTPGPKGWLGGRVELVDLDTSAVAAVAGSGTVSWGDVVADETPLSSGIPVDGGLKTEALSLANLTMASTASGGFDPVAAQIALPSP
ncbi:MAG TPA: HtaA domain-containing protein [Solirubrobacterales bacterium]|nr:HtaA domain-containing protein [Solirubrobacterales bacterium]